MPVQPSARARIVIAILLGCCVQLVFIGMRTTALLQAVKGDQLSPLLVGSLQAMFAIAPLASMHFGRLVDRQGPLAVMRWSAIGVAAPALLLAAVPAVGAAAFAGLVIGAAGSAYYVAHLKVIGELSTRESRFAWMSASAVSYSIATSAGPILSGMLIDAHGYRAAYLATVPFGAALALALWSTRLDFPRPIESEAIGGRSAWDLLRDPRIGTVYLVSGMLTLAWEAFNFLAPLFGARSGLSATMIGALLSTLALAMLIVRVAAPWIVRRFKARPVMIGALAIVTVSYAVAPFVPVLALFAIAFALGLAIGIVQPLSLALLYELSPPERAGEAMGLRQVVSSASQVAVPLAFGAVGAAVGLWVGFWAVSGLAAACLAQAASRWRASAGWR